MDFEQFKEEVKNHILEHLPEKYQSGEVIINDFDKNRVSLSAVMVKTEDSNVSPNVYLENFYNSFKEGEPLDKVLDKIGDVIKQHSINMKMELQEIIDFDRAKDYIFPRLIGVEKNEAILEKRPHTIVAEDLAETYAVKLTTSRFGEASTPITNELLDRYGISKDELHDIAHANLDRQEMTLKTMNEIMKEMMMPKLLEMTGGNHEEAEKFFNTMSPCSENMESYVVTNMEKCNGSNMILSNKAMDEAAEKLGGDFFVLPSSIHECILIPVDKSEMSRSELQEMVQEVNNTQVSEQDRLSDSVYAYDSKAHELMRADKYEERNMLKEKDEILADSTDKVVSFKDRIKEAKIEVEKENKAEKHIAHKKKEVTIGE